MPKPDHPCPLCGTEIPARRWYCAACWETKERERLKLKARATRADPVKYAAERERDKERDRRRYATSEARREATKLRVRKYFATHPEASVHHDDRIRRLGQGDATQQDVRILLERTSRCTICRVKLTTSTGKHVDHITPLNTGGRHTITNLRVTCAHCNLTRPKDGRDIDQLVLA